MKKRKFIVKQLNTDAISNAVKNYLKQGGEVTKLPKAKTVKREDISIGNGEGLTLPRFQSKLHLGIN